MIFVFLLLPSLVFAAPSVTGGSGTLSQGSTVTITGSSFTSHALGHEWTGVAIEAGTNGNLWTRTNWSDSDSWSPVNYATDQFHSGSKALKVAVSPNTNWNGLTVYNMPDDVNPSDTFYITWWTRLSASATPGQWKMLRLSGSNTVVDGSEELVLFNWFGSNQLVIDPGTGNDQTEYPGTSVFPSSTNTWYRMELSVTASAANVTNGGAVLAMYGPSSYASYATSALKTHVNSGDTYSYVIFQNYFGNGFTDSHNPTVWLDDIYIQNTFARVEICNTATWAARTHCEVQVPTAWSTTSIDVTVQRGSFGATDAAYVYIVDASNAVNSDGFAVEFGSAIGGGGSTVESGSMEF